MVKMTGGVSWWCVALLFPLTSVSAVETLNSIDDLKKIDFGQSVPAHTLVLLYWFAHTVEINNANVIRLTFDPENGDYGSHYYSNFERLLDQTPQGHRYYSVGKLNQDTSVPLPPYVVNPRWQFRAENRDRIILQVRGERVHQVYITQHRGKSYDPDHTYHITANLLRQIRKFPLRGSVQTLVHLRNRFGGNASVYHIRNTWGDLACLGLFLSIVMQKDRHNALDTEKVLTRVLLLIVLIVVIYHFLSQKETR